jgi:hypothetical protein
MHLMKYIQKYKTPIKLLHVSAPTCHHQGVILIKEIKYLVARAGFILLCQNNSLMMTLRCRNMWEFYTSDVLY